MPSKTRTPTYRLHKPTGQAVVTLNGRDLYLGVHGSDASRERYDRAIGEWLQNGRHTVDETASITIVELMAAYNRHIEAYYLKDGQPTSEISSFRLALRPLKELYGRTRAADFGPLALKSVRDRMLGLGWCRTVVNRNVLRVRQMFRWAVGNELVPSSVYEALKAVPGLRRGYSTARESDPVRPVPDEYVDALKPHVSKQVWAIIELQRLTGMRSGEVLIMRGCDLDMTGELWLYTPSSHKTEHHGHSRVIELGPKAQKIVEPFLKQNLQAFLFSPADAVSHQIWWR
jgi:integrase